MILPNFFVKCHLRFMRRRQHHLLTSTGGEVSRLSLVQSLVILLQQTSPGSGYLGAPAALIPPKELRKCYLERWQVSLKIILKISHLVSINHIVTEQLYRNPDVSYLLISLYLKL